VYEGLALKTALACERLQEVAGRRCDEVIVVGGGSHNHLVNQWIANATGLPVCTGSAHAAALGNALVQAKTLGWVGSLSEGHSLLDSDVTKRVFEPHTSTQWADAKQRIKRWAQQ
jgi:rhamnulokinase